MNEIEIADRLEEMANTLQQRGRFYGADGDEEALRVATKIIRDKSIPCEYCEDYTPNDSRFYDAEGEVGARFVFCPMCGRRLEVEHD